MLLLKLISRTRATFVLTVLLTTITTERLTADDFHDFLKPLLVKSCAKCHGETETKGKVNFHEIETESQFLTQPKLIKEMIEVIDANDMPPDDEPELVEEDRANLLVMLKAMLQEATYSTKEKQIGIRRLNRFQYNNAVRDLFQLRMDVFPLPEKLMTRRGNYLTKKTGSMPDRVNVASLSMNPQDGLKDVRAFPKDLRASHGFDNQANQLTLSPLLLDAFLKLSVSIVESPDFNEQNVGVWNEFFKAPASDADMTKEVRQRLEPFLKLAFRGPVDADTLGRYNSYVVEKLRQGTPFTDCMKKVASAALSSPMFLYRVSSEDGRNKELELASNLSFFLWGSCPDRELLLIAERGDLTQSGHLQKTIDRMLSDPKIERFLDSFPSQWMQLENVMAATPDPKIARLFSLDKNHPASLQMVLEPLLLFDAVFIEDRPIIDLIAPSFTYQSEFLKKWYTSDLQPPKVDIARIAEENRINQNRREQLEKNIEKTQAELDALIRPARERVLADRKTKTGAKEPVDLKPYAAWEFDGNLKESLNSLDLESHGGIEFKEGMVVLRKSYLLSKKLPIDLKAKTLEVWCQVNDLNQRGGGVMGIQGAGDFFDTIVLGERKPHHWISGSNGFSRTDDFPDSTPETLSDNLLHLVMVYAEDGTTSLYRNGTPYGEPYRKGSATFRKNESSVIFGLRHLPAGGNKYLDVSIDKARLYDRALTAEEVASSASGENLYVSSEEIRQALTVEQRAKQDALLETLDQSSNDLKKVPQSQDPEKLQQESRNRFDDEIRRMMRASLFERVPSSDPRYGGVITSAAMLSMTSGPKRTHPIARGAWIIEVVFNDPPPPPPNDVPPLNEDNSDKNLTIREKFAVHRENPDCAGCHSRLDPLGFALENFDITGRWREKYENGRDVDSSGTLMKKYDFKGIVDFKASLVKEKRRFAKAFTAHLLRFALSRELSPADSLTVDAIVNKTENDDFKLKELIREVILSDCFLQSN